MRSIVVSVLVAAAIGLLALLLAPGCSGPAVLDCWDKGTVPFTHERPTVPFHITLANSRGVDSWNADGAPTVLTVHNPTDKYQQVYVRCFPSVAPTYIDYGLHNWWLCLAPHQEKARLVEFMNIDAMTQVCHVDQFYPTNPESCYEKD